MGVQAAVVAALCLADHRGLLPQRRIQDGVETLGVHDLDHGARDAFAPCERVAIDLGIEALDLVRLLEALDDCGMVQLFDKDLG